MTRFGILGFGHHAIKRLMPAFGGAHQAQATGLWRRDMAKARENGQRFGIPLVFESAEELCASPDIDAVFVVSPDALHLEHVLLAVKHGKPVLCEKPLAMNLGEAEQMVVAAGSAGVALGVAQNMRYNASVDRMRTWIAEGRIGAPTMAHSQFCYLTEQSPRTWINDPSLACGGPIGDVGIHCMDALLYVLGQQAVAVNTLAHRDARSGELESHAIVALELDGAAMGVVTVSSRAAYRSYMEVVCEDGLVSCEAALTVDHPVSIVLRQQGKVVAEETVSNADAFSRMLDSFADSLTGGDVYRGSAEQGLRNQRTLDAAYASWKQGHAIRL